jgi:hypothetical protein
MSVDERSRLQLAEAAKRVFGADEGITLMELLPPVGWADVATKQDLRALEDRMDARFGRVDARFDRVDARFSVLEGRFDQLDSRFETSEYKILGEMHREMSSLTWKLFAIYGATTSAMIGALGRRHQALSGTTQWTGPLNQWRRSMDRNETVSVHRERRRRFGRKVKISRGNSRCTGTYQQCILIRLGNVGVANRGR